MAGVASGPDWILNGEMVNRTTSIMCIASRRQARKEKYFPISPNLASFASSRELSFFRFQRRIQRATGGAFFRPFAAERSTISTCPEPLVPFYLAVFSKSALFTHVNAIPIFSLPRSAPWHKVR